MATIELQATQNGLLMSAPKSRRFVDFARNLGAQPLGDDWLFRPEHEQQVRAFCRRSDATPPPAADAGNSRPFQSSLQVLLDPSQPLGEQVKSISELARALDPGLPSSLLEEASAAFESFAARLRRWATDNRPAHPPG